LSRIVQSIVTLLRDRGDELARYRFQGLVAEHLHGAVVGLERVVERDLVGDDHDVAPR
jgi:hypothetical protein